MGARDRCRESAADGRHAGRRWQHRRRRARTGAVPGRLSSPPARRDADHPPCPTRRRGPCAYFVPAPLGLDGEPLGGVVVVLSLGAGVAAGGVDGLVADGGDAEGVVRSAGRSPTRSVRDSLQAVSSPRLSATAQTPVSILFMFELLLVGVAQPASEIATAVPPTP